MKTIFLLIFIFLSQLVKAQNYSYFKCLSIDNFNRGYAKYFKEDDAKYYKSYSFTINGIPFKQYDSMYKIPINRLSLDTIEVYCSFCKEHPKTIAYAKFLPEKNYKIRYNPCSGYEILPVQDDSDTTYKSQTPYSRNFIRFIFKNFPKDSIAISGYSGYYDDEFLNDLQNSDTTQYHQRLWSGLCPYATFNISIGTKNNYLKYPDNINICSGISIQFLYSEKYTIKYDYKTKKTTVIFDGYYDKTRDFEIKEVY